jgi:hypothetical protein
MTGRRGGARVGAGRPPGSLNRRSQELAAKLKELNCEPAEGLARIGMAAEAEGDNNLAARCYDALMPYCWAKLRIQELEIVESVDVAEHILAARQRLRAARASNPKLSDEGAE